MNKLDTLSISRKIRVSYVIPGYPSLEESLTRAKFLIDLGIEILEIGVPFSDPVADGTIIRKASEQALENGIGLQSCIDFCKEIKHYAPDLPLILMTYLNPLYQFGYESLERAIKGVVDGLIVPDCPYEESFELQKSLKSIHIIPLITLNTREHRLETIAKNAKGFIYMVTIKGTTGGKQPVIQNIQDLYQRIKPHAQVPVIAGFGIQSPRQIAELADHMDGYVVASEIIKNFDSNKHDQIRHLFT